MGLGLIALAGGLEGGGAAAADIGKRWSNSLYEEEKQKAIGMREENLARLNNEAAAARLNTSEAGQDRRQDKTEAGATTRQTAGFIHSENLQSGQFAHSEALQAAQQAFQHQENEATRGMTREQIQSAERIASMNRSTSLEIAKLGGTVQQDKDGNVLYIGKDGTAKQITNPATGKPMTGFKDLTPAAKTYADVIKAQLTGLDREELSATTMGDKAALEKITERRADLNGRLLNVLTGGIDTANKAPAAGGPKAQWDDKTGDVTIDGKSIGKAKSRDEAINLARSSMATGGSGEAAAKPAASSAPAEKKAGPFDQMQPPAGGLVDQARQRKQGIIQERLQAGGEEAASRTQVQDDFNVDRLHMSPRALAEKYSSKIDALTDDQKAQIFKVRNSAAGTT